MNHKRNMRSPRPQGQPPIQQPKSRGPAAGYSWYHRRCPYWYYNDYDWYDYEDYDYDWYDYDYYDDYAWDEEYMSMATQKAFKAGVSMGMKRAKMMYKPEPMPPEPPMETKKGE